MVKPDEWVEVAVSADEIRLSEAAVAGRHIGLGTESGSHRLHRGLLERTWVRGGRARCPARRIVGLDQGAPSYEPGRSRFRSGAMRVPGCALALTMRWKPVPDAFAIPSGDHWPAVDT
jgi:hypothetical protein